MQTIADKIVNMGSWRYALLLTFVYVAFLAFVMAPQGELMSATAGPWGAPDGHFHYTADELYAAISNWSAEARAAYVRFRLGLDPLWALVYSLWLVALTAIGLRRCTTEGSVWRRLVLLPLLVGLADLTENFLGIALVQALPERLDALATLTAMVTTSKWSLLVIAHAVMLASLIAGFLAGRRTR